MDKRIICPKCHKRVNKMRAIKEEAYEWKGNREQGEYVGTIGFYNEVHRCGGNLHSEVLHD